MAGILRVQCKFILNECRVYGCILSVHTYMPSETYYILQGSITGLPEKPSFLMKLFNHDWCCSTCVLETSSTFCPYANQLQSLLAYVK